jgi:PAS domain S-box-containing protein
MARIRFGLRETLVVLAASALLGFGFVSFLYRVEATVPMLGVKWIQTTEGPLVLEVDPEAAGWQAGIREGDLLLRADGRTIRSAIDADQLGWITPKPDRLKIEVLRGAEEIAFMVEIADRARGEPYTYLSIVGLAFWVSGLLISLRWSKVRGGAAFSVLAFTMFAQLTLSHTGRGDLLDRTIYWFDVVAGALIPALLLHLGVVVARLDPAVRRRSIGLAYLASAAILSVAWWIAPDGFGGAYAFEDPVAALQLSHRLEPLLLTVCFAATIFVLARTHRTATGTRRTQVRWLLRGVLLGLAPFILLYHLPWALGASELPRWAQFVSVVPLLFTPAAFTAALARYRLNDLDLLLMRGMKEAAAVFCAFGIYSVTAFILREAFGDILALSRSGARYTGLFVVALLYPSLRRLAQIGIEKAFYRKRYRYRSTLLDWARELSAETDLQSLLNRLRRRVRETLDVDEADVLVRSGPKRFSTPADAKGSIELDEQELQRLRGGAVLDVEPGRLPHVPWVRHLFAMKVKGRIRALLAVGERTTPDEPLTSEDRHLLGTLAAHAATAIEAARLVQEVRHRAGEIERLHARQAKILESSAVGLLLLDADDTIQAWNRALEAIYGLSRAETIGRNMADVFPLHVVRRLQQESRSDAAPGEGRIFRISLVNKRGRRLIANLSVSAVDGDPGADPSRVVTFDDVSERVKLEEQVLRQERLASLGLLAAGVAHEINTPLTGISSYTQMLLEECSADDPRRQALEKIELQTNRAAEITGSLLNLARPQDTGFERVECEDTIREVVQLFEPQIRGRGIGLELDIENKLPAIPGHKGKLQQVLLNLLMNARDALDSGGTIKLQGRARSGKIEVLVEDDGVGIAEEDLGSIFDPFFTTKGRGRGTGLGLSITYGIVQEHGGEIHVESQPGEYTRFRVELPAPPGAQATA